MQRKANPLEKTLFSIIVPQHQQIVDWLGSLPFVDPQRIAFYGLSYGGKTAMRVPPLVTELLPVDLLGRLQRMGLEERLDAQPRTATCGPGEYEIFEFDLGSTFNYAEMAALIAPRPFMVERGHFDGVAPDETVAYEFAKVRFLYEALEAGRPLPHRVVRRPAHDPRPGDVRLPAPAPRLAQAGRGRAAAGQRLGGVRAARVASRELRPPRDAPSRCPLPETEGTGGIRDHASWFRAQSRGRGSSTTNSRLGWQAT